MQCHYDTADADVRGLQKRGEEYHEGGDLKFALMPTIWNG
jgi:hypothetical protein